jgi:hypothetical protein
MCKTRALLRAAFFPTLAMLLAVATMSARAEPLDSPLELMYAPDAMIVAGPLIEINPAGRIVIQRKEVLSGKDQPPDKIDVRTPIDVPGGLKIGERYVVAYSMYRRDTRNPVAMAVNPDGATALVSPGIEPAVFRDTPQLRAILKAGRTDEGRESRRLLDLLLTALGGADAQLANLAAGELVYEPELGERLRDADRALIEKTVRDPHASLHMQAMLLEGAARRSKDLGDWWRAFALQIVTTTPVDGYSDKAPDPVALILTAFEVLDRYAVKVPPEVLKRWVWNPNPPVVEKVCVLLRRESPEQERSTIQLALADPKLPGTTRKFLNDHLRRLDRMNERARTRKEGSG